MTLLERTVDDPSLRWRKHASAQKSHIPGYPNLEERVESAPNYEYVVDEEGTVPSPARANAHVSLRTLYRRGALLALGVAVISVILWLLAETPIVNPFLSVMIILMSPFIYFMGKIESR